MQTIDQMLDALTDHQLAFVEAAVDAFEATMPIDAIDDLDGEEQIGLFGVALEDLAEETVAALSAAADAVDDRTLGGADRAGRAIAPRLFWQRDSPVPGGTTPRLLVQLRALEPEPIEPDSERTQLADHLAEMAKDRRVRGEG